MIYKKYPTYSDYVQDQKNAKWDGKEDTYFTQHHRDHMKEFRLWFAKVLPFMELVGTRSLCLGPSFCAEVVVLREMGSDCTGLDLVPLPPWSIEGDFHNIQFGDGLFDFVYSNALDHTSDIDKFLSEAGRVLRPGGLIMFHLHIGQGLGGFEVLTIKDPNEVVSRMPGYEVLLNERIRPIPCRNKGMNWTLLFHKPGVNE